MSSRTRTRTSKNTYVFWHSYHPEEEEHRKRYLLKFVWNTRYARFTRMEYDSMIAWTKLVEQRLVETDVILITSQADYDHGKEGRWYTWPELRWLMICSDAWARLRVGRNVNWALEN